MIERTPKYAEWAGGMPGGIPENPLGARALYLFNRRGDTQYRIHGTNAPSSIGTAASSGCIRMLNHEVIELYERTRIGTKVIVL
jgi:lipoprotein-anchoring transpeptidase ErfK/SrfK